MMFFFCTPRSRRFMSLLRRGHGGGHVDDGDCLSLAFALTASIRLLLVRVFAVPSIKSVCLFRGSSSSVLSMLAVAYWIFGPTWTVREDDVHGRKHVRAQSRKKKRWHSFVCRNSRKGGQHPNTLSCPSLQRHRMYVPYMKHPYTHVL